MRKKKIIWTLVLLAGAAGPLSYFGYMPMGGVAEESIEGVSLEDDGHGPVTTSTESFYMTSEPPFIVNFTHLGALRYLQISLEVMYPEKELLDRVDAHMPAIRNALILLLSDQPYEKLSTLSGKEELRDEMVAAVNEIIYRDEAVKHRGEMFITNFVMQ